MTVVTILLVVLLVAAMACGSWIETKIRAWVFKRKKKQCDHQFVFHNPKIMEHEPFCKKCKKTLIEINF